MTKNFIEVGETYQSVCRASFECIHVDEDFAWCKNKHSPAYVFYLDGTPFAMGPEYRLLPPGPRISKTDANLHPYGDGEYFVVRNREPSGTFYTHEDAKVALFVPKKISKDYLRDVLVEILEEEA